MPQYLTGSLAGVAATALMTAAFGAMFRRLPREERYPLPPREITMEVARRAGLEKAMSEEARIAATLATHFAFGAAAGALYPTVSRKAPVPPVVSGMAYGLAIWGGSYFGWVPALGILKPATEHPPRRTLLMILAHVVWGGATAVLADRLECAGATFLSAGEHRDAVRS